MPFTWFSKKVEKRSSAIEGRGLFAIDPIESNEIVVVKGGHVFDRATRDVLEETLGPAEIQIEDDLFIGPMALDEREASMMHLNHSCEPNLGLVGQISYAAMRRIEPGEELTFDYATGDDDLWEMACQCGAPSCRGTISGKDWQHKALQEKYSGWFAPYLQRKIDRR